MSEYLLLSLVMMAGLAIRLPFSGMPANDSWVVLNHLEHLRTKRWLDYSIPNSVFLAKDGYPILLHFFLSRLPRKWWKFVGIFSNSAYDLITGLGIYILLNTIIEPATPNIAGMPSSVMAALLFLTAPILFPPTSRLRTVNSRTAGLPLVFLYLISIYLLLYSSTPNEYYQAGLIFACVFMVIVMVALSMFAIQAIIFFSLVIAIGSWNLLPLAIPLVAILISTIPRLGLRPALGHHWNFKVWYWRNYKKGTFPALRNTLASFINACKNKQLGTWVQYFVVLNTLTATIIGFPILLAISYVALKAPDELVSDSFSTYSCYVLLASIICFAMFSIPRFSFLGQAERYFEYSAPFAIILLVSTPSLANDTLIWSFILIHCCAIVVYGLVNQAHNFIGDYAQFPPTLLSLADWINEHAPNARILTNPVKYSYLISAMSYRGILSKKVSLYFRYALRKGETGYKYFEKDITSPHGDHSETFIKRDPFDMAKEYDLTHILLEKRHINQFNRNSGYRKLANDPKHITYENDEFLLLQFDTTDAQ